MLQHAHMALLRRAVAALLLLAPAAVVKAAGPSPAPVFGWYILKTQAVGSQSQLNATVAFSLTNAWAVGTSGVPDFNSLSLIEQWNGRAWTAVPHPTPAGAVSANLLGVAGAAPNDVWAVGRWDSGTGLSAPLAMHWNGAAWSLVATPPLQGGGTFQAVTVISSTDAWAVGDDGLGTLAEHWNGQRWSIVPMPSLPHGGDLEAVTAISSTDVWAVGSFFDSALRSYALIMHWNGTAWSAIPSPYTGPSSSLTGVSAVSASDVWAVGQSFPSNAATLTEHWNGTAWSVVPGPSVPVSQFYGVTAISSTDVWAVGTVVGAKAQVQTLAERWNGTAWSVAPTLPLGYTSAFLAVASTRTAIFAVGDAQLQQTSIPGPLAEAHAA